ncbi:MAG: cyclic-phosphate processing receiver domain-containing protein [Isosphaeraceae bacterium]
MKSSEAESSPSEVPSRVDPRGPGFPRDEIVRPGHREGGASSAIPRILFLDDDPHRAACFLADHPDALWVQTAQECIERLSEPWDSINLDHDLGGEIFVDSNRADCGMEVVRWLCTGDHGAHLRHALFIVHTHNLNVAAKMVQDLREAGYEAVYRPFGIDILQWLDEPEPVEDSPGPATPRPATAGPSWLQQMRRLLSRVRSKRASVFRRRPPGLTGEGTDVGQTSDS